MSHCAGLYVLFQCCTAGCTLYYVPVLHCRVHPVCSVPVLHCRVHPTCYVSLRGAPCVLCPSAALQDVHYLLCRCAAMDTQVYLCSMLQHLARGAHVLCSMLQHFARGAVRHFLMSVGASLGAPTILRIWTDNSAKTAADAGWYLDKVIVEDLQTNKRCGGAGRGGEERVGRGGGELERPRGAGGGGAGWEGGGRAGWSGEGRGGVGQTRRCGRGWALVKLGVAV